MYVKRHQNAFGGRASPETPPRNLKIKGRTREGRNEIREIERWERGEVEIPLAKNPVRCPVP